MQTAVGLVMKLLLETLGLTGLDDLYKVGMISSALLNYHQSIIVEVIYICMSEVFTMDYYK